MDSAAPTVVDFEAYRARKLKRERATPQTDAPHFLAMPAPIAWMPVWVVPVFYMVGGLSADVARG
jgi:hypothetical protein